MNNPFKAMDSTILSTFGKPVTIIYPDETSLDTQGIISREQIQIGQCEAIAEDITVLTIASHTRINRGDKVLIDGKQWEVDRKIKDDGYLEKWNIYEA